MNANILWIDDKIRELDSLVERFRESAIPVTEVDNAKDAIICLQDKEVTYDAIIIDGLFYRDTDQDRSEDDYAFKKVMQVIRDLFKKNRGIPFFIFSGQTSFTDASRDITDLHSLNGYGDRVYIKTEDDDQLIDDVIKICGDSDWAQARVKYGKPLSVFSNSTLLQYREWFIEELKAIAFPMKYSSSKNMTTLRQSVERLTEVLVNDNLLPTGLNLNQKIRLLYQDDTGYKVTHPLLPHTLSQFTYAWINLIQDATHDNDALSLNYVTFNRSRHETNTVYSICFLHYLNILNEVYEVIHKNKPLPIYEKQNLATGALEQDEDGNYHVASVLLPFKYADDNYKVGQILELITITDNRDSRTKVKYPKFCTRSQ